MLTNQRNLSIDAHTNTNNVSDRHSVLVVNASPRKGVCAQVANEVLDSYKEYNTQLVNLRDYNILPCNGCGACYSVYICSLTHRDDTSDIFRMLEACDELALISPIYFSGPPAILKALIDRMQVYWARIYGPNPDKQYVRKQKRPMHLYAVGAMADIHGYDPLIEIVTKGFALADFKAPHIVDLSGRGL